MLWRACTDPSSPHGGEGWEATGVRGCKVGLLVGKGGVPGGQGQGAAGWAIGLGRVGRRGRGAARWEVALGWVGGQGRGAAQWAVGQLPGEGWEARGKGLHGGQLAFEGWEARVEGLQLVGGWAGRGGRPGARGCSWWPVVQGGAPGGQG